MRTLIIGGTRFLGRHLVEAALDHRHEVTLFNRGKSNPDIFPQLETILGDREKDVNKLQDRIWDAVIDVAGYVPRIVRLSAEVLEPNVRRYVFISTISVYADFKKAGIDESYPVGKLEDETVEEITGETYGPLKVLCERAVQDIYGERALIVRPGLIVGPHDPTDRFTYWPVRVARGGDVLAPQKPEVATQIIDVREPVEVNIARIPNSVHIPLAQVLTRMNEIDPNRETVVHCKMGGRSARAIDALQRSGFKGKLINLKGGIIGWSNEVDPSVPKY